MTSQIDPSLPVEGNPTTASVRANFATAQQEISTLQNNTQGAPFLPIGGGTMQGPMSLHNDPTALMHPVTLGYFNANGGGGGSGPGGVPEAPADGSPYARQDAQWVPAAGKGYVDTSFLSLGGGTLTGPLVLAGPPATALNPASKGYTDSNFLGLAGGTLTGPLVLNADPSAALGASTKQYTDAAITAAGAIGAHNVGRNLLDNALWRVAARGQSSFGWVCDRWGAGGGGGDAINWGRSVATDAMRAGVGDEHFAVVLSNTFSGTASGYNMLFQRMEDVQRLSGKTITVSFFAAASAAIRLGINMVQMFGTGGTTSPPTIQAAQMVTLSTAWARYSATFNMPSAAGKQLGTNQNDLNELRIYLSAGASNTEYPNSGNLGAQSGTVWFWGMQLEVGPLTPLEHIDRQTETSRCERFFQLVSSTWAGPCPSGGNGYNVYFPYRVIPRGATAPTFTIVTNTSSSMTSVSIVGNMNGGQMGGTSTAAGFVALGGHVSIDAEL